MGVWDAKMPADAANESREFPLAKPGVYEFEVIGVTGKEYTPSRTSKIGKCAEIDLTLRVETPEGDVRVWDRLYSDPATIWKMTAFAKCIDVFSSGMTPGDLLKKANGCIGKAEISVRPAHDPYPASNVVKRYIVQEKNSIIGNEDLPF